MISKGSSYAGEIGKMRELLLDINEGLALVTLNRPEKLNALSAEMLSELTETFQGFGEHTDLRAVILTGAGEKAFCAGTDLSLLTDLDVDGARAASERGQAACDAIEHCQVPVIAAINGLAAGGGFELALACHLRVAEAHVRFSMPEAKHGLLPAYGGTQRLPRILGTGRALGAVIAGEEITTDEALNCGLINRVAPAGSAVDVAIEIAGTIATMAPLAVRACLKAVVEGLEMDLDEGLRFETDLFSGLFNTRDAREGAAAFLAKRPPVFTGS